MSFEESKRIQYLTNKMKLNAVSKSERKELIQLLGLKQKDYKSSGSNDTLLAISLTKVICDLLVDILCKRDSA